MIGTRDYQMNVHRECEQSVVHLVHGTCPHGLLKLRKPIAWFEDGSPFRTSLQQRSGLKGEILFQQFEWSGRNSVRARSRAAKDFALYLHRSIKESECPHLIIAHSHGGTIAEEAICDGYTDPRLKALICLSHSVYVRQ